MDVAGSACIPAALTLDILGHMPDELMLFERNDGDFQVAASHGKCRLSCTDITDYPKLPDADSELITFPASSLVNGVRQCLYAADTREARPILTGLQIAIKDGELTVAAIDGHRIATAFYAVEVSGEMEAVVPARVLREVERLALAERGEEIGFRCDGNIAVFEVGEQKLVSSLLQGTYPDFRALIPTKFTTSASFDRKKLLSTVEQFKALSDRSYFVMKMALEPPDMVKLEFNAQDTGSANFLLHSQVEGESLVVGLSIHFLIDTLKAIDTNEILIRVAGPTMPIVIEPLGSAATHVIMPVHV